MIENSSQCGGVRGDKKRRKGFTCNYYAERKGVPVVAGEIERNKRVREVARLCAVVIQLVGCKVESLQVPHQAECSRKPDVMCM